MDKKQYQEAIDLFEGYIYDKEVAELEVDSLYYGIYKNFMLPSKNDLCFSSAFIVILAQLSRPLNFFKFHIDLWQESNQPKVPMNIYAVNILRSGGGKGLSNSIAVNLLNLEQVKRDYVERMCKNLMYDLNANERKDFERSLKSIISNVAAEEQSSSSTAGMRVMEDNLKNNFNAIGLTENRWVGSAFYNLQELADSLENANAYDKDFLSTLKEMYDLGKFSAKALKSGVMGTIKNFYISFLGSTTDKTLLENPRTARLLFNFFVSGHARRSLVCMPCEQELSLVKNYQSKTDGLSLRDLVKAKKYIETPEVKNIKSCIEYYMENFANRAKRGDTAIKMTDEAYFYYVAYKLLCAERAKNVKNTILALESENRFWKALKISGLLALYSNKNEIDEVCFCKAVRIVEYYAHHLKRFLNNRVYDVNDKIVELLLSRNVDEGVFGITLEELRTNPEILAFNEKKIAAGQFVKNCFESVEEILDKNGYRLISDKKGFNNKITVYAAVPNDWVNPCIEDNKPYKVFDNVPKGYRKEI